MNYLFYLGIIIPTVITIVLFLVFIYCWFLQKARKEVLTKRYDPHGKMRRLGIPLDPPSPPPYCRVGAGGDFFPADSSSGEDNEAYDVSRSPSTEQNVRGRPMYRTYHDSGFSAGLSLSPTQEGIEPSNRTGGGVVGSGSGGFAYRSCPDSGISGFGVHTMQTSACVHQHQCRGCCHDSANDGPGNGGGENIQMQLLHQQQRQLQQQQQHFQQLQQQPSAPMPPSSSYIQHHQQHQQHLQLQQDHLLAQQQQQVILHHNTIQASVHPNHGVCYGDDTTHPQSPQHYNPPPYHPNPHQQLIEMTTMGGDNNMRQQQSVISSSNVNSLPHSQELPASCVLQRTNEILCCNNTSPEHLSHVNLQQIQSPTSQHPIPSCCQYLSQHQHHHNHQQQNENITHSQPHLQQTSSASSHSLQTNNSHPQPDTTTTTINSPNHTILQHHQQHPQKQANYVNENGGVAAIESSSAFRAKPSYQIHNPQGKDLQHPHRHYPPTTPPNNPRQPNQTHQSIPPTQTSPQQPLSYPSTSECQQQPIHSYRDSGLVEAPHSSLSNNSNSSPSDRPDSQASTSSTTDSEDSGFRSSRCAVQHNNALNKHGNPLLKPLRRPKTHTKSKTSKRGSQNDNQINRPNTNNSNKHYDSAKEIPSNLTPLTTLNPQNLSSQHEEHHNDSIRLQTTPLHNDVIENGGVGVVGNNSRAAPPPRILHLNGQNQNHTSSPNHNNSRRTILQLSPTKESIHDWSTINHQANDNDTKSKRLNNQQQNQQHQQQHFDMSDISTHLSWKYLQDMSAASSKSTGSDGSNNSSVDDSHRVVSPLLRHAAPPEQSMDVFSFSVV